MSGQDRSKTPLVISETKILVCGKHTDRLADTTDHVHGTYSNNSNHSSHSAKFDQKDTDIQEVKPMKLTKEQPMTVWFVLGPIGAGKSSYINTLMRANKLAYLSADIVKREQNLSYADTRILMEKIIQQHIDSRTSFITEGTGQHDDLYDLFVEYKSMDIDLKVTFIDVDLDVALERNKNRTRVLSDDTVREVHRRCMERRHRWKEFGCTYISYKDLLSPSQTYDHIY